MAFASLAWLLSLPPPQAVTARARPANRNIRMLSSSHRECSGTTRAAGGRQRLTSRLAPAATLAAASAAGGTIGFGAAGDETGGVEPADRTGLRRSEAGCKDAGETPAIALKDDPNSFTSRHER